MAKGLGIVFESEASNLAAGDTNGARDVFLYYNPDGTNGCFGGAPFIELISVSTDNQPANGASADPSIAEGGNYIAFSSLATNLGDRSDCNAASDVFVRDYILGRILRASLTTSGYQSGSGKGHYHPAVAGAGILVA